ncbi:uncharacterized protein LOC112588416 [Harpegnathos saltator]|uniref:uncharacterized protein LOC112588416 n=1 Tax=Harpegnathos saltator TaxID=610380 RepID=UPI000DBEEA79|nr:uncharacterized protein LOC112588416 [Harpegnathos saltator]
MKWCEVDRSRVSLLQSRRYPPVAAKNRRRHIVDQQQQQQQQQQQTKDRPVAMHHQFHVGYNGVQGGTNVKRYHCRTLRQCRRECRRLATWRTVIRASRRVLRTVLCFVILPAL